jgi:hypothetical protein
LRKPFAVGIGNLDLDHATGMRALIEIGVRVQSISPHSQ